MYQRLIQEPRIQEATPRPDRRVRAVYRGSAVATVCAAALAAAFVVVTVAHVSGRITHADLRIVAHILPIRDHPHLLKALHPLVHLADSWFVLVVSGALGILLWARGYRRTWALPAAVVLSWPIELACKAALPQPTGLPTWPTSVQMGDLVKGPGASAVLQWLRQATPSGVDTLVRHAGGTTLGLYASYPSGTTARGAFVLALLAWACLRLDAVGALLALLLSLPMAGLGFAIVLYAWHWPSDVMGGYLLGLGLAAAALALLRRPAGTMAVADTAGEHMSSTNGPHSPYSRLPWVPNRQLS